MTGPELRAWRRRLHLSQEKAAELCGLSRATWQRWEYRGPNSTMIEAHLRLLEEMLEEKSS